MIVRMEISLAWWLRPYLAVLIAVAVMLGREPDLEKLQRVIQRAVRLRVLYEPIDDSETSGGTTPCC